MSDFSSIPDHKKGVPQVRDPVCGTWIPWEEMPKRLSGTASADITSAA